MTAVYPTSQLAEKTRLLLYDLLHEEAPNLLPISVARSSRLNRFFHKYYMGRWPKIFNLDFMFRIIAIAAVVFIGLNVLFKLPQPATDGSFIGLGVLVVWLLIAVLLNWTRDIDIFLTYGFRTGTRWRAVIGCATLGALWLPIAGALGAIVKDGMPENGGLAILVAFVLLGWPLFRYAFRGIRNIKFDNRYIEGGFRILFTITVSGAYIVVALQ